MSESVELPAHGLPAGVIEPPTPEARVEQESVWDEVAEASWESFPASDPPAWIGHRSEPSSH